MQRDGLRIEGDRGETHILPAQATDNPAAIGGVDYVLCCVKLWDVEATAKQIRPIVGPETAVVPLQNGIDAHEQMITILGREPVNFSLLLRWLGRLLRALFQAMLTTLPDVQPA